MELHLIPPDVGGVQRIFIVVAQEMVVVVSVVRGESRRQQAFRKNHASAQTVAVQTGSALSDAVKAVGGRNHPCIQTGAFRVLSKLLEDSGFVEWGSRKIVERLVHTRSQA